MRTLYTALWIHTTEIKKLCYLFTFPATNGMSAKFSLKCFMGSALRVLVCPDGGVFFFFDGFFVFQTWAKAI